MLSSSMVRWNGCKLWTPAREWEWLKVAVREYSDKRWGCSRSLWMCVQTLGKDSQSSARGDAIWTENHLWFSVWLISYNDQIKGLLSFFSHKSFIYLFVCVRCVHVCEHVYMQVLSPVWSYIGTRGLHQLSSSVPFHLNFWDRDLRLNLELSVSDKLGGQTALRIPLSPSLLHSALTSSHACTESLYFFPLSHSPGLSSVF